VKARHNRLFTSQKKSRLKQGPRYSLPAPLCRLPDYADSF
jgi:hypothetical protein